MKIIISLFSLFLVCNAQTTYIITAGSIGNRIDLSIQNQSDQLKPNIKIEIVESPSWLEFKNKQYNIKSLNPRTSVIQPIEFTANQTAPINQEQTVKLEITDGNGVKSFRTYSIRVQSPYVFSLSQNYPNPFNPNTTIEYQIPNNEFVSLKVFDVLGKEVKIMLNEFKNAGKYSIVFDASQLSSGLYFYRLQAGSHVSINKMMLLK